MLSENQKLATNIANTTARLVGDTYNSSILDITTKFANEFRQRDMVLDIGEVDQSTSDIIKYWTPLSFTRHRRNKRTIETRLELTRHVYEDADKFCSDDRLTCIGNGCIDEGCIMIVGMTAGFRGANYFDSISFPYKFSFYFGDTSFLLREGFYDLLHLTYFTNVGKYSYSRAVMETDDTYIKTYDDCLPILQREIEYLKPSLIISAGKQVHEYLTDKGIESYKITHPSYYLFKRKIDEGAEYYSKQAQYIKDEFLCTV